MNQIRISALNPELPARESTLFKAAVTLIWPYSSSARQLALLLAEPDFRLRRKKGQVRARFSGSSARALATTGVGIGDEVILGLRGAQFVQEGAVSTPGKSVDWELSYSQTVEVRIFRNGTEIANVKLDDVAPTPAPLSPVRHDPTPASVRKWSSPAFMKRVRLSDGPLFEAPYDPLPDEAEHGHDKKRRRKSYRDWKAWTYSARTPSPEKDVTNIEDDFDLSELSPSRPNQFPDTPVSPEEQDAPSVAADLLARIDNDDKERREKHAPDNLIQDDDYHELDAGTNEVQPADSQYAFGGDTEVDTEVNTEDEDAQAEPDIISLSSTTADSEDLEDGPSSPIEEEASEADLSIIEQDIIGESRLGTTEEGSPIEMPIESQSEHTAGEIEGVGVDLPEANLEVPLRISMPPPVLPSLRTDFPVATSSTLLTPTGRQPASPTLQPLDSATLPLPSPFPGEPTTGGVSSFLDHVTTETRLMNADLAVVNEQPPSDANYISETSFFSPINSLALHPDHEIDLASVRFTFGMDVGSAPQPRDLPSLDEQVHIDNTNNTVSDLVEPSPNLKTDSTNPRGNGHMTALPFEELNDGVGTDEIQDISFKRTEDPMDLEKNFDMTEFSSTTEPPIDFIQIIEDDESVDASTMQNQTKSNIQTATETVVEVTAKEMAEQSPYVDLELLTEDRDENTTAVETDMGDIEMSEFIETREELAGPMPSYPNLDPHLEWISQNTQAVLPADITSLTNLENAKSTFEDSTANTTWGVLPHTVQVQQKIDDDINQPAQEQSLHIEEPAPQSIVIDSNANVDNASIQDRAAQGPEWGFSNVLEHPRGVDIELVEETSRISTYQPDSLTVQNLASEQAYDENNNLRETRIISTPPPGPARKTRSKEKAALSLDQDEMQVTRRTTRLHKSKVSISSTTRSSISPPRTIRQPAASPTQSATQTSPYRLRSHSKPLSPTQAISTTSRRKSRKHASQGSLGSLSDFGTSQKEPEKFFVSSDQLIQARGTPQTELIDSHEPSLRFEQSQYPVQGSGAHNKGAIPKDAPPPLSITQPGTDTSSEKLVSIESPVSSPRNTRRTRRRVYGLSPEVQKPVEETSEYTIPQIQREIQDAADRGKLGKSKSDETQLQLSEYANVLDFGNSKQNILPAATNALPFKGKSSVMNDNHLITPEATQQSLVDSEPGFHVGQQRQQLPMTPQLTQTSSAGLQPLQYIAEIEKDSIESSVKSPRATRSTDATQAKLPSMGLSTPLAYYTPLRDLAVFLNRSSQLHSSDNPDLLALVTSPTTTPERAKKGPKHWNTTLHITDLSTWPATTTVNVFRAFQTALPQADIGDIILLRAFAVKSLNRHPMLISADESSWCVWRYGKPMWDSATDASSEIKAREEINGPSVEKGDGELQEVGRLHNWYLETVKSELEQKEDSQIKTRSKDKVQDTAESNVVPSAVAEPDKESGMKTRSKNRKARAAAAASRP